LGIKHAFEADHLIAVSTMLAGQRNASRAALIGTFWGVGHTTTLFVVGLFVLLLRLSIPSHIAERLEVIVGVMLVLLGMQAIRRKIETHEHEHIHDGIKHTHLHSEHKHQHRKSFFIGMVHGLAGSGSLMVLVLSLINSTWQGILYILLFGLGSIISMTFMSLLIGIPLSRSLTVFNKAENYIRLIAGVVSILFGVSIIYSVFYL
jgi:sulfite exporter TauE/SafE